MVYVHLRVLYFSWYTPSAPWNPSGWSEGGLDITSCVKPGIILSITFVWHQNVSWRPIRERRVNVNHSNRKSDWVLQISLNPRSSPSNIVSSWMSLVSRTSSRNSCSSRIPGRPSLLGLCHSLHCGVLYCLADLWRQQWQGHTRKERGPPFPKRKTDPLLAR